MSDKSAIEWTDATWNPIVGCSIVSPGCTNCYAMKMAGRIQKMNRTGGGNSDYVNHYDRTTQPSKSGPVWTGKVARAPEKLFIKPLSWKSPRKIFVNSMGDLFHESIPEEWIDRVFAVMALCPQHTFQVLTKRAERMRAYFDLGFSKMGTPRRCMRIEDAMMPFTAGKFNSQCAVQQWPLPNVWLGVSTERQQEADERIPLLLQTPAAVRFISAEPLLGPLTISYLKWVRLDWVICGGESGPNARPMHPDWARSLRDQCKTCGVPFFFKQWGEWIVSGARGLGSEDPLWDRVVCPSSLRSAGVRRVGKKAAGRLLDGKEHNEFPSVLASEPEAA